MSFVTDQQELLTKEDITQIHNDGAQFLSIHRADLHNILLKKLDPSTIHMGTTLKSIQQTPQGLEVEFNDHSRKTYDLVIGADGIHSKVRQLAFDATPLVYQGIANWRTVIDTPSGLDHPIYMLGDTTVFLLYPINNNQTYIYAHSYEPTPPKDNPSERAKHLKTLFKQFKGYVPQALKQINDSQKIVFGLLESVSEIAWVRGNVLLIGDASHGCSPMLQQGGAQALEDGLALGEELNKGLKNDEDVATILKNFVNRRYARVEHIVRESDKRIKILPALRNEHIKKNGAPNVAMFKVIMKTNP
jgi:2-polyprenyl-6-methoxyphenol hydroxylase-like FAD-dependent oxidoreductase